MIDNVHGLHIEPTNLCTLKCSGCARTRFIQQWPQHWQNHSLDIKHVLDFLDIDLAGKTISLCGNTGDPIYHPEFIDFVAALKKRKVKIHITTNGSYKKAEWWQELVALLDCDDVVRFSVDGAPENFTNYRENADWNSIQDAMQVCAQGSCQTVWKYIPFKFNLDSIDQARQLSESLGLDKFVLDPSDRFDQQTDHLLADQSGAVGPKMSTKISLYTVENNIQIDPRCKLGHDHYISADGFYNPCCYVSDYRFLYKTPFGKNRAHYDIKNSRLSQILTSKEAVTWFNDLQNQPVCQFNCPKTNSVV
jgi:organic radical activating enzyme